MRKRERLILYLTSAEARESIDISHKRCLFRTVISTVTIHDSLECHDYTDKILDDFRNVRKCLTQAYISQKSPKCSNSHNSLHQASISNICVIRFMLHINLFLNIIRTLLVSNFISDTHISLRC